MSACFRNEANLEPLSISLQNGFRFFYHLAPAVLWLCRQFPNRCFVIWRRYGLSMFHIIDNYERFRSILSAEGQCCPCMQVVKATYPTLCTVLVRACQFLFSLFTLSRQLRIFTYVDRVVLTQHYSSKN